MPLARIALTLSLTSALGFASLACSSPSQERPPALPRHAPAAPLHRGPLSDFVPAPSLRWLVLAQPDQIARAPGLLALLRPLISDEAFEAFSVRNGFDLRASTGALVAGFDYGTLYLLHADGRDAVIADRFRERLLQSKPIARPHPSLTRITGVAGTTPESLLRANDQLVAIAIDNPSLVRLVEGYLLERFRKTPPALRGSALAPIATFAEDAPLRVFFPGPFSEQEVPGPLRNALLSAATAVGVAVSFREAVRADTSAPAATAESQAKRESQNDAKLLALELRIVVCGDFSQDGDASERLRSAFEALTASSAARWFGLNAPLRAPTLAAHPDRLELSADFDAARFLRALHGAADAELRELFPDPLESSDAARTETSPPGSHAVHERSRETPETGENSGAFRDP